MSGAAFKKELDEFGLKFFQYFDKKFIEVDQRFGQQDEKMDKIMAAIDAYTKEVEIFQQESIARDAQIDRLQHWIEQIAKKTGVKLEY